MATSPSTTKSTGWAKYGDLKGRLIFLLLALVVYRIGAHVPVPGIDPDMLRQLFSEQQGGILGLFNMYLRWRSVALLGVCSRHHALHLCIDHHADAVVRAAES